MGFELGSNKDAGKAGVNQRTKNSVTLFVHQTVQDIIEGRNPKWLEISRLNIVKDNAFFFREG